MVDVKFVDVATDHAVLALHRFREGYATQNTHGEEAARFVVPLGRRERWDVFDWQRPVECRITRRDGSRYWTGRLEDVALVDDGLELKALGYQSALFDQPLNGLYRVSRYGHWRIIDPADVAGYVPDRFALDNNNRLYFAPRKGEDHDQTIFAGWHLAQPELSHLNFGRVAFTWDSLNPGTEIWRLELVSSDMNWGNPVVEWSHDSAGGAASGTEDIAISAGKKRVFFRYSLQSATPQTFTGTTGDVFARLTGLSAGIAGTVSAGAIMRDAIAYLRTINPTQMLPDLGMIRDDGPTRDEALYQDQRIADLIAAEAAAAGYGWRVRHKRLEAQPGGTGQRLWHIDLTPDAIERTLAALTNSAYGVYRDEAGVTRRTQVVRDDAAWRRTHVDRRHVLQASTTSNATAEQRVRDFLDEQPGTLVPRGRFVLDALYGPQGERVELTELLAGDLLVLRNLPPDSTPAIDRVRRLVASRIRYDLLRGVLEVEPQLLPTTLDAQLGATQRTQPGGSIIPVGGGNQPGVPAPPPGGGPGGGPGGSPGTPPSAPITLTATAAGMSQINLDWVDTATDETGFQLQYSLDSGSTWLFLANTGSNVVAYQHQGLQAGTEYCYRVRAFNAAGFSAWSNVACATTDPPPPSGGAVWSFVGAGTHFNPATAPQVSDYTWNYPAGILPTDVLVYSMVRNLNTTLPSHWQVFHTGIPGAWWSKATGAESGSFTTPVLDINMNPATDGEYATIITAWRATPTPIDIMPPADPFDFSGTGIGYPSYPSTLQMDLSSFGLPAADSLIVATNFHSNSTPGDGTEVPLTYNPAEIGKAGVWDTNRKAGLSHAGIEHLTEGMSPVINVTRPNLTRYSGWSPEAYASAVAPSPIPTAGLYAWHRATSLGLADGANVATWKDSSNNGRTLTTSTGAGTVVHRASVAMAGGRPSVDFALGQMNWPAAFDPGQSVTMFFAVGPTGASGGLIGLFTTAPGTANALRNFPAPNLEWHNNSPQISPLFVRNEAQVLEVLAYRQNGSRVLTAVNDGDSRLAGGNTNALAWVNPAIGRIDNNNGWAWQGHVFEIIVYNRLLSGWERSVVREYLAARHGNIVLQRAPIYGLLQGSGGLNNATSQALNRPTEAGQNDLLWAVIRLSNDQTVTAPAGWTFHGKVANGHSTHFYTRPAQNGDPTSFTFTWPSNASTWNGMGYFTPSTQGKTPFVDAIGFSTSTSTNTHVLPSVTPTVQKHTLMGITSHFNGAQSFTPSAGALERLDVNSTFQGSWHVQTEYRDSLAATGTRTVIGSGTSSAGMIHVILAE